MTNEEIERQARELVRAHYDDEYLSTRNALEAATAEWARSLVSGAIEDAARVAEQCAKEADEWAAREGLPPDHGGDPEIAERIRALKPAPLHPRAST